MECETISLSALEALKQEDSFTSTMDGVLARQLHLIKMKYAYKHQTTRILPFCALIWTTTTSSTSSPSLKVLPFQLPVACSDVSIVLTAYTEFRWKPGASSCVAGGASSIMTFDEAKPLCANNPACAAIGCESTSNSSSCNIYEANLDPSKQPFPNVDCFAPVQVQRESCHAVLALGDCLPLRRCYCGSQLRQRSELRSHPALSHGA